MGTIFARRAQHVEGPVPTPCPGQHDR